MVLTPGSNPWFQPLVLTLVMLTPGSQPPGIPTAVPFTKELGAIRCPSAANSFRGLPTSRLSLGGSRSPSLRGGG